MSKEKKLGRGLGALFGETAETGKPEEIAVESISPNPHQPRRTFDEDALAELALSVKQHGVVQPVIIRKMGGGAYSLIAGERRLRAAKLAGLLTIPAIIREYSDSEAAEIALIENLQREDLDPVEEGRAYKNLIEEFGYTQEKTAEIVGKSRPHIANMMRLLTLPEYILDELSKGNLTPGQVRPLLTLFSDEEKVRLARRIETEGLTARAVETIVKGKEKPRGRCIGLRAGEAHLVKIEDELRLSLGTRVYIKAGKGRNVHKGSISISYGSEEEFQRIIAFLKNED